MTHRHQIAAHVAEQLFATEEALDAALMQTADLVALLPRARQQARLSARIGQPAIEQVVCSLQLLSEARRQIVAAHQSLADCTGEARVPAHNFGGFIDKPAARASARIADLSLVSEKKAG